MNAEKRTLSREHIDNGPSATNDNRRERINNIPPLVKNDRRGEPIQRPSNMSIEQYSDLDMASLHPSWMRNRKYRGTHH